MVLTTRTPQSTESLVPVVTPIAARVRVIADGPGAEYATLEVHGELDSATAYLLRDALAAQRAQGRRYLRLNLSRLTFLDCAGLGVMAHASGQLRSAGGSLVLVGVGHRVVRLIALTGLTDVLLVGDEPVVRHEPRVPRRGRHLRSVAG